MANPMYGQNKLDTKIAEAHDDVYVYNFDDVPMYADGTAVGGAAKAPVDGSTEETVILQFSDGLNLSAAYMGACTVDAPTGTSLGMTWNRLIQIILVINLLHVIKTSKVLKAKIVLLLAVLLSMQNISSK